MNVKKKVFLLFKKKYLYYFKDTHIIFRVDFNNFMASSIERRLMQGPKLPDVTSATFFKVRRKKNKISLQEGGYSKTEYI